MIGIVNYYFKSINENKIIKMKIHQNNKFYYNFCAFHENHEECYSFFVDQGKILFYCFGCGQAGDVFDFLRFAYAIDINEATEIILDVSILKDVQLKIYYSLIKNYDSYDILLFESKKRKII